MENSAESAPNIFGSKRERATPDWGIRVGRDPQRDSVGQESCFSEASGMWGR